MDADISLEDLGDPSPENRPARQKTKCRTERKQICNQKTNCQEPNAKNTMRISLFELIYKGITCKEMLRKERSD
jgi:hypothetical protein